MPHRDDFHDQLIAALPRLRAQALAFMRNHAAAEDLLQDTVTSALAARDSFTPGTNFAAWTQSILRNRFLSLLRRTRKILALDDLPEAAFASKASQEEQIVLREVHDGILRLPSTQRTALLLVVLCGLSYGEVAEATSCASGTAKSRVARARRDLQAGLMGHDNARNVLGIT